MPVSRLIVLNGNAGAFIDILATLNTSRIIFTEDDAAPRTGIQVKTLLDNFATINTYLGSGTLTYEPVQIPDGLAGYDHMRKLLGLPAQGAAGAFNFRAADRLISVRGNGAGTTTLRFTEYE